MCKVLVIEWISGLITRLYLLYRPYNPASWLKL
jgi:hypothetical protein